MENVLSLSQQQMESVRDGNEHHHLQSVHHHFGMGGEGDHHHHPHHHHHQQHHQHQHHHHHHQIPGSHFDGQHFVLREEMPGVPHYGVREGDMQGSQQALIALAGGMAVVAPDSHEDHQSKLEIRWTEQGFCEARPEANSGHQMVKDVGGVRWEQPMFNERVENVSVMESAHHVVDGGHVVLQPEGGRWEDPSLCDANDEEELPNDGEQLDSKRTREVRWTEQALCDAVQAVKSGTLTAYKASKDYGIPRSTLRNWLNGRNRSRKRGPRVDEALSFCRQELPAEPAGSLMMSNEVTINSGEEGHGSDSRDDSIWRKRRQQVWTKQTLLEALNAVRNGELSVSRAAQVYSIPHSTLDYWLKEHEKKAGMEGNNAYVSSLHGREEYGIPGAQGMEMHEDEEEDEEEDDEEEEEGGDDQMPGSSEKKERLKKKAREGKKKVGGWTEKALMEAMDAIKNNTLTICKASRAYGIPRTTLRNWITGRTRSRKRGPHTGLPYEQTGEAIVSEEAMKMAGEDFQYNEVSEDHLTPGREDNGESDQRELGEISMSGSKRRGKGGKWSEQALLDAVEAVRNGSCTVGTAGQQFGIPQTPLKYSVNGLPKNSPSAEAKGEEDEMAFEAVEMKEPDEKKKTNGWTEQALQDALQAVKNGFSIRKAGQHFGIPRTTLRNWLNGRTHSRKRGPHGGMTRGEQESAIVEWFFSIQQVCQSLTTLNSLRRRVATLSVNKGSPFKDGIPVKKWWLWFNRRHPDVAARVSEGLQDAQHRNLIDEMSVVHMVTGEHLQILRRKVESEQDDLALVRRADDMDSSSQDEHEDHHPGRVAGGEGPVLGHPHLVENGMLNTGGGEHVML